MKVFELLKASRSLLETMNSCGAKASDLDYIVMYEEYVRLKADGFKITYIVEHLSDEYSLSVRSVFSIIKRFEADV